jgi:DNA polymerase III delta subunit
MVYLFIGQDSPAKDIALKRIKEASFPKELEQFNFDTLYAEDLTLKGLQEKLLNMPVKSLCRVLIIRNAHGLKEELQDFILKWVGVKNEKAILILDIGESLRKNAFINNITKHAKVIRFKEDVPVNTFNLSREIDKRSAPSALRILSQLIKEGERAERILGGLRYSLENSIIEPRDMRRKARLLLNCDIEIKTGKFKPVFALEKLVVNLCALVKASG